MSDSHALIRLAASEWKQRALVAESRAELLEKDKERLDWYFTPQQSKNLQLRYLADEGPEWDATRWRTEIDAARRTGGA